MPPWWRSGRSLPEFLVGLSGLEADVEIDGRLNVAMAKDTTHILVVAGVIPEDQGRCRVPELVHRDPQASCLLDPLGDLAAQRGEPLPL
jgi:hypothetical protein